MSAINTRYLRRFLLICLYMLGIVGIVTSGGGNGKDNGCFVDGYDTSDETINKFEIMNPAPDSGGINFGADVIPLTNGNIIVTEDYETGTGNLKTRAHLIDPLTGTNIVTYEEVRAVTALGNNNFVIITAAHSELKDGDTGTQIGDSVFLPSGGASVTALENNNFVVSSESEDVGPIMNAGSVQLYDGDTGIQIGSTLYGDNPDDQLGREVIALSDNNFVIASRDDDVGLIIDTGSVMLVDGNTGLQIGTTFSGDNTGDQLGYLVVALTNNNFVIASQLDDVGLITDAGSVVLVDGDTGLQIGSTLYGDNPDDRFGNLVTPLSNDNFVVSSNLDDIGLIVDAGSILLFDGGTGLQIGNMIPSDRWAEDELKIIALRNSKFVVTSPREDVGGIVNAGAVRLIDGTSGNQIGETLSGDKTSAVFGRYVTPLTNSNFLVYSPKADNGCLEEAGSLVMVDGVTGQRIGNEIPGDNSLDTFGGAIPLENGDFMLRSWRNYRVDGEPIEAYFRLMNGESGDKIGAVLMKFSFNYPMPMPDGPYSNEDRYHAVVLSTTDEDSYIISLTIQSDDSQYGSETKYPGRVFKINLN